MFEDGSRKRVIAVVVFLMSTGHVRVSGSKGNKLFEPEVFLARTSVPSRYGQGRRGHDINVVVERPGKQTAEGVSTRVVMKRTGGFRGHGWHLLYNFCR